MGCLASAGLIVAADAVPIMRRQRIPRRIYGFI
jgi:hypothetical protein